MDFNYTEEQSMLRDMVRKFTDNEVKPVAQRIDKEHNFDLIKEILKKGAELGLLGIPFPEAYGGAGFGEMGYCILLEELSRGCASTTVTERSGGRAVTRCGWPTKASSWAKSPRYGSPIV